MQCVWRMSQVLLMHVIALLIAIQTLLPVINYAWVEMMEAGHDPLVPHFHQ